MRIKFTMHYDQYGPGDVAEIDITIARRLLAQGRAVLASTQQQLKMVKEKNTDSPDNKMVTSYKQKQKPGKKARSKTKGVL
jgi:hypothetical protein